MKIFVTGGSGFIGSHLLPVLVRKGHEVLSLERVAGTHGASCVLQGDLYEPDSYRVELERFRPDGAIHLAWGGLPDYSLGNCRRNLLAGIDLFEALWQTNCKRIFVTGTCWEYGSLTGGVGESDQGVVTNLFAASKMALHAIGQSYSHMNGSLLVWGRPFFVYGPGQRASSLIPSCYSSLRAGVAPTINNPTAVNDFVHVADVADAIRALVESDDAAGIYNIGTGRPAAVWEVVNAVAGCLGLPPVYRDMPAATAAAGFWADTGRMDAFGWRPAMSLEEGIAQSIATWKKELN